MSTSFITMEDHLLDIVMEDDDLSVSSSSFLLSYKDLEGCTFRLESPVLSPCADLKPSMFDQSPFSIPAAKPESIGKDDTMRISPRIVSMDSMAHFTKAPRNTRAQQTATHYDSLKDLVHSKRRQATNSSLPDNEKKRSSTSLSSSLQLACMYGENFGAKRTRLLQDNTLHRACRDGDNAKILHVLVGDHLAAGRPAQLQTPKSVYHWATNSMQIREVKENFTYPLNLALQSKMVDSKTVEKLIQAAPEVLNRTDGAQREYPIHVLLKYHGTDLQTADLILLTEPSCASAVDRHFNTPLHTACTYGASVEIIRHLCILYPDALLLKNFHGLTPLEIAQKRTSNNRSSEQVSNFLLQKQKEEMILSLRKISK